MAVKPAVVMNTLDASHIHLMVWAELHLCLAMVFAITANVADMVLLD